MNILSGIPSRDDLPAQYYENRTDLYFNVGVWFGWAVGWSVFIGTWIAAIGTFWLLGIPFGWIPASVMGRMAFYAAAWAWGVVAALSLTITAICLTIAFWPH